jgi:hypothetical protein
MNNFFLVILTAITPAVSFCQLQKPSVINEHSQQNSKEQNYQSVACNVQKSYGCWEELDGSYTNITNSFTGASGTYAASYPLDDGSYGPIDLGWNYSYYGETFTSIYINVNGNITFGNQYSAYSASGFPSASVPGMIAPFWGDVDLRGTGTGANQVYFKLESNRIIIQWIGVGYYNQNTDVTNTFQLILTDGTDPSLGSNYNTRFAYGDMNWCVGDASGGSNGFGSTVYATVGAQTNTGSNYYQIGLFGKNNYDYDGAGGALDGVHYLDGRCVTMDLTSINVPPVANDLPNSREVNLCPGMTYNLTSNFVAPEVTQSTSTVVTNSTLSNFSSSSSTGNLSEQTITIVTTEADIGTHVVTYTATDNGSPVGVTIDSITINVFDCAEQGTPASLEFDGVDDYVYVQHHWPGLFSGATGTFGAWVYPETQTSTGEVPFMFKDEQFFLGMNGATGIPKFKIFVTDTWYTVNGVSALPTDRWTHVAGTFDETTIKIYVDGQLQATGSTSDHADTSPHHLYFGKNTVTDDFYKGKLDDLQIWNGLFTGEEIGEYRFELGSADTMYLEAHYKLRRGVVVDDEKSDYAGVLFNFDSENCWKTNYATVWSGAESNEFDEKSNWEEGFVPIRVASGNTEATQYVVIKKVESGNVPFDLNTDAEVNDIIFNSQSAATINTLGNLKVYKNLRTYESPNYLGDVTISGLSAQNFYGENNFYNLNINGNVTLHSDQKIYRLLTLNTGVLDVNGYEVRLVSDSTYTSALYHNSGTVSGDITMERWLEFDAEANGWHYMSAPMSGITYNQIDDDLPLIGLANGPLDNPWPNVMLYDETNTNTNSQIGWWGPGNINNTIDPTRAFVLYTPHEDHIIDFTGSVNNGQVDVNLTNTASGNPDSDGWNFIGNPYPSMLDWDLITQSPSFPEAVDDAIYFYDYNRNQYATYINDVGTNGGNQNIGTMQGFFIHTNANTTLELNNDFRIIGDNQDYRGASLDKKIISIIVDGMGFTDETVINFDEDASTSFDIHHDALKLGGYYLAPKLYTKIGIQDISINSEPFPELNKVYPLYFEPNQDGLFTIESNYKGDFGPNATYYLEDIKEGVTHDFSTQGPYSFTSITSDPIHRFNIYFVNGSSSEESDLSFDEFNIYSLNKILYLNGVKSNALLNVYSLTGQLLRQDQLLEQSLGTKEVDMSLLRNGVYIIELIMDDEIYTQKVLLK